MHEEALTPNAGRARTFAQEYAELGHSWERDTHGLGPVAVAYLQNALLGYPIAACLLLAGVLMLAGWLTTLVVAIRPFGEIPRTIGVILCSFATVAVTALMRVLMTTIRECLWVRKMRAQYTESERVMREEHRATSALNQAPPPWR